MSKLHIKKGDTVYVNSGESRGRKGKVLKVYVDKQFQKLRNPMRRILKAV